MGRRDREQAQASPSTSAEEKFSICPDLGVTHGDGSPASVCTRNHSPQADPPPSPLAAHPPGRADPVPLRRARIVSSGRALRRRHARDVSVVCPRLEPSDLDPDRILGAAWRSTRIALGIELQDHRRVRRRTVRRIADGWLDALQCGHDLASDLLRRHVIRAKADRDTSLRARRSNQLDELRSQDGHHLTAVEVFA